VRWKKIAGLAGLVIIALVVILYVIVTTYDFNRLKPRIVQAVRCHWPELTLGEISR
jgi:multisubunit Na+/H+ antiporter MnhB subunit